MSIGDLARRIGEGDIFPSIPRLLKNKDASREFTAKQKEVLEVASIADYEPLREEFLDQVLGPLLENLGFSPGIVGKLVLENQLAALEEIFGDASAFRFASESDQFRQDDPESLQAEIGNASVFRDPGQEGMNRFFIDILRDPDKSRNFLRRMQREVDRITRENLDLIDKREKEGFAVLKDVVIVGGGPATAVLAKILSPFCNITVISRDGIGEPWLSRSMYINSSSTNNPGPGLPLLDNDTTPIVPRNSQAVRPSDISTDNLTVACDDGSSRMYADGSNLGRATVANLTCVSDFIVGQEVDWSKTRILTDNAKRIVLVGKDGRRRSIDAKFVIGLTGPGFESCDIPDIETQRLYEEAVKKVDQQIEKAKKRYKDRGESGAALDWDLPPLLNLTLFEKLNRCWKRDLNEDPAWYPFRRFFESKENGQPVTVGIIGGGDTAKILSEFLSLKAPRDSYPPDYLEFGRVKLPQQQLLGAKGETPETWRQEVRRRYSQVFTRLTQEFIRVLPGRVSSVRKSQDENLSVEIQSEAQATPIGVDYAFLATGLQKVSLNEILPQDIRLDPILDAEDEPVVVGDQRGLVFGGSSIKLREFPERIQRVIELLGISENTVSLWVNATLLERFGWSFLADPEVLASEILNKEKIQSLINRLPEDDKANSRIVRRPSSSTPGRFQTGFKDVAE